MLAFWSLIHSESRMSKVNEVGQRRCICHRTLGNTPEEIRVLRTRVEDDRYDVIQCFLSWHSDSRRTTPSSLVDFVFPIPLSQISASSTQNRFVPLYLVLSVGMDPNFHQTSFFFVFVFVSFCFVCFFFFLLIPREILLLVENIFRFATLSLASSGNDFAKVYELITEIGWTNQNARNALT